MELTTLLGIIFGIIAVVGAMIFKHISFGVLLNPAAFMVIFVGTIATILNAYTGRDLKNLGRIFKVLFTSNGNESKIKSVNDLIRYTQHVRKEGILSLEKDLNTIENKFLQRGLRMIVDGIDPDFIVEVLETEIDAIEERHAINASIFSQAGGYAPTLGVMGAVFGLIAAMANINDTAAMAEAISAAFIATILGIFTGYVLWNPFANKLKIKSKHEILEKRMIIEGLLAIQKGSAPSMVQEKLMSFLTESEKELILTEG
ncbi:flagellar motor stator protein MotA [Clostridium paraputrificum]|uniref:flagellar motor stator protein MotA n=1 Tax=Clostridium paraputrificum TaxID=29363 RepID=UPI003D34D57C